MAFEKRDGRAREVERAGDDDRALRSIHRGAERVVGIGDRRRAGESFRLDRARRIGLGGNDAIEEREESIDDGLYVLKFRGAGQGPKALAAELVVGEVARVLGLPVPELVFADLDPALGAAEPDPEIQELIAASGGRNLGMDFLPGALPFTPVRPPGAELAATRYVDWAPQDRKQSLPPHQRVWLRADGTLPDDPVLHTCVLTYASDMTLLDTSTLPHALGAIEANFFMASLDHAMWFHRPFRADDWLLYVQDSPTASDSLGLARGLIFTRTGELAVSVVQEGLLRVLRG